MKIIYINIKKLKEILESDIYYLFEFVEQIYKTKNHYHCKYCSYLLIICYLIKREIIKNFTDNFSFDTFGYMINPSNLFLRCIFIENFHFSIENSNSNKKNSNSNKKNSNSNMENSNSNIENSNSNKKNCNSNIENSNSNIEKSKLNVKGSKLNNEKKLSFIKSKKEKSPFNQEIFKKSGHHPFELYEIKKFLVRFKSILIYIDYLMSLEKNDNLNNFIEYYFDFMIDFIEKIKLRYTKNVFIKEDDEKKVNIFYSSEELTSFFILYIKYDEVKALEIIKKEINSSFFKNHNPFYFRFLYPKFIIKDENSSNEIKSEIINNILEVITRNKKEEKEKKEEKDKDKKEKLIKDKCENILIFVIIIYKNIYLKETKMGLSEDFPNNFCTLFSFLKEKNILLNNDLIDINNFNDKEEIKNKIEERKLICEILLDIIFKFFFRDYYSDKIIQELLFKNNSSSSVFYDYDEQLFSSNEKNNINDNDSDIDSEGSYVEEEKKNNIFKQETDEFSLCLYFLIYFFEKDLICQESEQKNTIKTILETIFRDLKKLYINIKKLSSRLKKIKKKGKMFDIYNEILDIFNKNYKDDNFDLTSIQGKYPQIIEKIKNEAEKEAKDLLNEPLNQFNEDENDNKKNLDENKHDLTNENYIQNNEINKDVSDIEINSNIKNRMDNINSNIENEINNIDNNLPINYLKEQLGKIDFINLYFKLIVGDNYSKNLTKILINPKEYYIWNQFSFFIKDYIFFSKKFKKLGKSFNNHINKVYYKHNYNFKENNNFFMDYPTKIRNYTIDEYYRPFLKPCMKFFDIKLLNISHKYIKENILKKFEYKEDYFNLIKYKKIIPKLSEEKYFCELFKNKGNIFGYIELNSICFLFKNSPDDDTRKTSDDPEKILPFSFSFNDETIIDKDKYILIFYDDIKEIIKRRVCLLYIGLEIFLKDNRSYMFNFFSKNAVNKFIDEIKKYTQYKNNNEELQKKDDDKKAINNNNSNPPSNKIIPNINKSEKYIKIIEDPINEFKKLQLKLKNKKIYLSNFNYLLLINKYSSRTYNDYNQYLVFPLLYMDIENKKERDLSKALCLHKENYQKALEKIKSNYEYFNYHFNQHYSTSGFILFYLVRSIPFTYQHILFQSNKFDVPNRLFSSFNNLYYFFEITDDNRELIPEFYHSFEFLVNLNYNDFGVIKTSEENYHLNNVDTYCKYSFPEYIIKSRNNLEKFDLSPWIDNIFGVKQTSSSEDEPNLFPLESYEKNCKLEDILKEDKPINQKVEEIKEKIDYYKFGMTPAKLFNKVHEKINNKNYNKNEDEINNYEKKKEKSLNIINKYIQKKLKEKVDYFFINSNNNNEIELIFKFKTKIDIFKLKFGETKNTEISFKIQEQIDFDCFNNSLCEILPDIYCTVRHIDNTISFNSGKKLNSIYHFNCLITSVENKYNKNSEDKTNKEIFIGDENGFLHLIEIEFNLNEKLYEIKKIKIKKSVKVHERFIKGLLHDERLNIIFSWSDENENYIAMNNDYNLNLINIIKLEKDIYIKEILVSKYDLIYINSFDKSSGNTKVYCYTLNGIKVSFYECAEKIIKCFDDENLSVITSNNNGYIYNLYTFEEILSHFFVDFTKSKGNTITIKDCQYYPHIKNFLMICSDNKAYFYNNEQSFIIY